VLKSTFAGTPQVDTNRIVVDEVVLLGSRCGPMDRAVEALASGAIDPTPLIDARYPLAEGPEAIAHAGRRGTLKVLLTP
jgi:threonine dehydrogenase-like Zn-dependent dehydrogenase